MSEYNLNNNTSGTSFPISAQQSNYYIDFLRSLQLALAPSVMQGCGQDNHGQEKGQPPMQQGNQTLFGWNVRDPNLVYSQLQQPMPVISQQSLMPQTSLLPQQPPKPHHQVCSGHQGEIEVQQVHELSHNKQRQHTQSRPQSQPQPIPPQKYQNAINQQTHQFNFASLQPAHQHLVPNQQQQNEPRNVPLQRHQQLDPNPQIQQVFSMFLQPSESIKTQESSNSELSCSKATLNTNSIASIPASDPNNVLVQLLVSEMMKVIQNQDVSSTLSSDQASNQVPNSRPQENVLLMQSCAQKCSVGSSTVEPSKTRVFPCRARGMPLDHNAKTAYFELLEAIEHGDDLKCAHPLCQGQGVKFQFCMYCDRPVAKRNFRNRHLHIDQAYPDVGAPVAVKKRKMYASPTLDAHLAKQPAQTWEQKRDAYTIVTSDSSTVPSSNTQSFHNIKNEHDRKCSPKPESYSAVEETQEDRMPIKKRTKELSKNSFDPEKKTKNKGSRRKEEWAALLESRPELENSETMVEWLEKVLEASDDADANILSGDERKRFKALARDYVAKKTR